MYSFIGLLVYWFIGLLVLVWAGSMNAAHYAVDTGPGPDSMGGPLIGDTQYVAARFDLYHDTTITAIEGWMSSWPEDVVTAVIYTEAGPLPGVELFLADFSASTTLGWQGADGLNWDLALGTYWVSFEVYDSENAIGSGVMPNPSESPLQSHAFWRPDDGWQTDPSLDLCVRILTVPIPAAAWLFGSALLGLGVIKRKRS